MIENMMLVEELPSEDKERIASSLIDNLPMGMLIVNESCEIEYSNSKLESFFEGSIDKDKRRFGNRFSCRTVLGSNDLCGTRRGCKSCKLKMAFSLVQANKKSVKNISYKSVFGQGEYRQKKWFDINVFPIEDSNQFIVLFNDQTPLLSLKDDAEVRNVISGENATRIKHEFHDEIIDIIESQSYNRNIMYFLHIKVCDLELIKNQLGQLWVEDFTYNIYRKLVELKEIRDLICKMTEDDIVICFRDKDLVEVEKFMEEVNRTISHRLYQHVNLEQHVIEIELNDIYIKQLINDDRLYMTYFEILNKVMQSEEKHQKYRLGDLEQK